MYMLGFERPMDVILDHVNTLTNKSNKILNAEEEKMKEHTNAATSTSSVFSKLNIPHSISTDTNIFRSSEASFDIFYPFSEQTQVKSCPVLIFLHGGYWQALDKKSSCWCANTFRANGEMFLQYP